MTIEESGSLTQPFGFSTKRYDEQTGLIYYGFRFYGPEIGRWTTRDPLGEAGGMNLYAFVGNNPVNWVDPFGLKWSDWFLTHNTPNGEVRSPLILRAAVPGQIAFDRARNDFRQGDFVGAGLNIAAMLGEQLLVVSLWGQASALVQQGISTIPEAVDSVCEPSIPDAIQDLSKKSLKHLAKHLADFQKLDPTFTLDDIITLGGKISSEEANLISQAGGRKAFEEVVNIGGQNVTVRAVLNTVGKLRSVHIRW